MTNYNGERLERVEALAMSNAKSIEALTQSVNIVALVAGRSARAIEALAERAEEDRVNFREFLARTDATLASINASIERPDKILDDLLKRDGNNS